MLFYDVLYCTSAHGALYCLCYFQFENPIFGKNKVISFHPHAMNFAIIGPLKNQVKTALTDLFGISWDKFTKTKQKKGKKNRKARMERKEKKKIFKIFFFSFFCSHYHSLRHSVHQIGRAHV